MPRAQAHTFRIRLKRVYGSGRLLGLQYFTQRGEATEVERSLCSGLHASLPLRSETVTEPTHNCGHCNKHSTSSIRKENPWAEFALGRWNTSKEDLHHEVPQGLWRWEYWFLIWKVFVWLVGWLVGCFFHTELKLHIGRWKWFSVHLDQQAFLGGRKQIPWLPKNHTLS